MDVIAPVDLRGTIILLNLTFKWKGGVVLTGSIEIQPVYPAEQPK